MDCSITCYLFNIMVGSSFYARGNFLRSTILLLRLNHNLKYRNGFLHYPLHPMELDSFIDIFFQDIIVVLRNVVEYHCLFNAGI